MKHIVPCRCVGVEDKPGVIESAVTRPLQQTRVCCANPAMALRDGSVFDVAPILSGFYPNEISGKRGASPEIRGEFEDFGCATRCRLRGVLGRAACAEPTF